MKRKVMRLLVLGDEQVGKTSLISAMMYDTEGQKVKKLNKVSLSPQRCIYSKDVFTELIDTDQQTDVKLQIQQADIILLVYDISQQQTIARIQTHWLPIISTIRNTIPVILVGNKLDKKELQMDNKELQYTNVRNIIKGLAKKYRQVQMGFECSAYYDRNVKKVLNCAQRAVLYPLAPLYDLNSKQLTPKFKKAITRIFRILDKDLDGKITDNELRMLQQRVFQTDLNGDDIKAIKEIILRELQQYNQDFIKLSGFFALQKKCIQMLKIQICWSILRFFNYNDNLQINPTQDDFILDENIGQTLELSQHTITFLQNIYSFAVKSKSENETEMQYLFSCSNCPPLEQFLDEGMTLQKFLLAWNMFAFLNYKQCFRNLLYIGYQAGLQVTFKKVRSKKTYPDLLKLKERKIFSILLVESSYSKYQNYLTLLFKNSITFKHQDYLQRAAFYYNEDTKTSKIVLLLKIKQKYLEEFLERSQLNKRIDLVVTFEHNSGQGEDFGMMKIRSADEIINFGKEKFPGHTMFRKITKKEAERIFSQQNLPSLNLNVVPVEYKQENWQPLFSELVKTFEKLQLGYSLQKIQKLKKQSQKLNKIWAGVGIISATVVGCVLLKKNPLSLIKDLK